MKFLTKTWRLQERVLGWIVSVSYRSVHVALHSDGCYPALSLQVTQTPNLGCRSAVGPSIPYRYCVRVSSGVSHQRSTCWLCAAVALNTLKSILFPCQYCPQQSCLFLSADNICMLLFKKAYLRSHWTLVALCLPAPPRSAASSGAERSSHLVAQTERAVCWCEKHSVSDTVTAIAE